MEEERPDILGSADGGYLTLLSSAKCPDKRTGSDHNHCPPSSTEVANEWSYTPTASFQASAVKETRSALVWEIT